MSNYLAIATVTAALSDLMQDVVNAIPGISGDAVTTQRPAAAAGGGTNTARINIYLYQITHNPYLGNSDLPTRRSDGTLLERPQVALNLHYLLSFYGNETDLEPERLLAKAITVLNAQPPQLRAKLRSAIEKRDILKGSDLADQSELVKFTPLGLTLEEFSKLWSVFFQTTYTLSIAYAASVVVIAGDELPESREPVRTPAFKVGPAVPAVKAALPDTLADLQLWLSSDKGIVKDGQGQVSGWLDQSDRKRAKRHDTLQANATSRPKLVPSGLKRKPALRFDGNDHLAIDELHYEAPGVVDGITLFALVRSSALTPQILVSFDADQYWSVSFNSAAGGIGWHTHTQDPAGGHSMITKETYTDGNWHLVCVWYSAGAAEDKQIFVDGVKVDPVRDKMVVTVDGTKVTLPAAGAGKAIPPLNAHAGNQIGRGDMRYGFIGVGSKANAVAGGVGPLEFLEGELAELALFARGLTAEERQQVERYFIEKYTNP